MKLCRPRPFSPSRPDQGLDHRDYSPKVVEGLVTLGVMAASFEEAARFAGTYLEVPISGRHLQNLVEAIGVEVIAIQDRRVEEHGQRRLGDEPTPAQPPLDIATVMIDGGRIQVRGETPAGSSGVHDPRWRETKNAVLLRQVGPPPSAEDPRPEPPRAPGQDSPGGDAVGAIETLVRTGLSTLADSDTFGVMLDAAAERRGFHSADRKAFLGDGLPYNGSIRDRYVSDFVPILDIIHVIERLNAAAKCLPDGEATADTWLGHCWRGEVGMVLGELDGLLAERGPAAKDAPEDHPVVVLTKLRTYLANNRGRMDDPRYRRAGLPISSSPVESWIKQINRRVKGSEKFWSESRNGEVILRLRAAWLSDDESLQEHLATRRGSVYARPRRAAA